MINFKTATELAIKKLGKELFENITISTSKDSSGLKIIRNDNNLEISYDELSDFFRGLTYFKEHINEKNYSVSLKKHFNDNGQMIDCSRNGVVNIKTVKEFILLQALMGLNRLYLYTEETYEVKKYPMFGYLRGAYTKDELKEVVDYGESFGVHLIPCIQTLGHLNRFVHWEKSFEISDGPSTLLIGEEKTYEFIEECIKVCRECFKSKDIHIGMDESTEIGLGRYLAKNKFTNRVELFSQHLDRVIKICNKYDFEPMIWSDMYFRLNTKNEEYYRDEPLPESTLKLIPKGVKLVYWDYYHLDKETYDNMNKFHAQTGNEVVFAGGAWRWKGYTPSVEQSLNVSDFALQSAIDNKLKSVFVTAWGDNGNEASLYSSLPTLALYSVYDYYQNGDRNAVNSMLKAITGDDLSLYLLMDLPDRPNNQMLALSYNPSKFLLYQDPLLGMFDSQVKPQFSGNYKSHAEKLMEASKQSRDYSIVYKVLSLLCSALMIKVDLGVKLREAYKAGNKQELKDIISKIPELISILDELNENHRNQWFGEFKQFGFDVVDGRMGYLKNRLLTTKTIVEEYLAGKIEKIEELEVDILPFNGWDYEISWNWWSQTVTPHNLA